MLLPERLAVGLEGNQHIIERFVHRNRTTVRRRVGALDEHPLVRKIARSSQPSLVQKRAERDAGVLHVVDHAMGELDAVQLRARPFHAGIGGAFAEVDVVLAREALEILVGEDQRPVDEAVDHEPVVFLRKLDGTRVVFE